MTAAARLATILQAAPSRLADLSDEDASRRPAPDRWSKKEILGHLIDSAGNNHQRIVRAQIAPPLDFPAYAQEPWVAVQSYATESWPDLVNLWLLLNRHLLHIIQAVPTSNLPIACAIGANQPIPLSSVIDGYVDHLEHHLESIIGSAA
jgi:hypothetical protein